MKLFWGLLISVLIFSSFSNAAWVSVETMDNDTVNANVSEEFDVSFQITNVYNETKNITLMINAPIPMEIEGSGIQYNRTYKISELSNKVVSIDFETDANGTYQVDYSVDDGVNVTSGLFYAVVGNKTEIEHIGMELEYPGFVLRTRATDPGEVEDLIIQCSRVEVDFTHVTINLSGFDEDYVECTKNSVWLDVEEMPTFKQKAFIRFYSVLPDYTIYANDSVCPNKYCQFEGYASKRLIIQVEPFNAEYRVESEEFDDIIVETKTVQVNEIPPMVIYENYTNSIVNATNQTVIAVEIVANETVEQVVQSEKPEEKVIAEEVLMPTNSEPMEIDENLTVDITFPNRELVFPLEEQKTVYVLDFLVKNPKDLLISSLILGFISMVLGCGALFYYIRGIKTRGV